MTRAQQNLDSYDVAEGWTAGQVVWKRFSVGVKPAWPMRDEATVPSSDLGGPLHDFQVPIGERQARFMEHPPEDTGAASSIGLVHGGCSLGPSVFSLSLPGE